MHELNIESSSTTSAFAVPIIQRVHGIINLEGRITWWQSRKALSNLSRVATRQSEKLLLAFANMAET